ncbi:MAG: hypothetical protein ACK4IY_00835, partial [Chitinophagales bacterium]
MWEHTTGLPDTVSWCAHTQDGDGYAYVTGNTIVSGDKANILTTKYDRAGEEIWQVSYNSSYDDNDYGTAITVDIVGNVYVAAASFTSATNQYDYRVVKYDSTGSLQWTNTYNDTGSLYDLPSDILVDDAGNVYITGGNYGSGTGWDYATVNYNSIGTQQWASRYNYNDNDYAASGLGIDRVYGFAIDGDDNIYLTGRAAISGEGYNIRTVKMDSMLTVQWNKQYDAAQNDDACYALLVDMEGNVYVTGSITNADEIQNGITIKYNSAGTLQWTAIQTANNSADLATWNTDISLSEEGEIIIAGITHTGANKDLIIYRYNSEGEKQWTETWNGPGDGDDTPYFVGESFDFGGGELDPYFATFNENKVLLWATPYGGTGQDFVTAIVTSQYSGSGDAVYFLGYTGNNIGETDMDWPAYSTYESSSIDYYKDDYTDITSASVHSYDGFITKFSDDRINLLSTLFGGNYDDRLYDAVMVSSKIWFIGSTQSDNTTFPYTPYPDYYDGQDDLEADEADHNGFLAILTENSELIYATYFGNKQGIWAQDIAVQAGPIYNYIITTGDVHFDFMEASEFTPLAKPFVNSWFNPVNPTPYLESKATFITEWYKLPVPVSIEEESGFDNSI